MPRIFSSLPQIIIDNAFCNFIYASEIHRLFDYYGFSRIFCLLAPKTRVFSHNISPTKLRSSSTDNTAKLHIYTRYNYMSVNMTVNFIQRDYATPNSDTFLIWLYTKINIRIYIHEL